MQSLIMIDTHSHIHGREFTDDFEEVLERAEAAGVDRICLVGVNPDDADRALEVAKAHPGRIYVVAGQHPHEAKDWDEGVRQRLREQIGANPGVIVAVGEMGLDYHYDFAPKDAQKRAFKEQLELAREVDLPIVIHCREAYDDCLEILRDFYGSGPVGMDRPRGVLHCYFGTAEQAREAVGIGFMLGIGGACTFKKAEELQRVVAELPLECFVLETDAPYMAPVPFRGKRNESGYLSYVAARMGELKGLDAVEVAEATTANAMRLYRWG